MQISNQLQDEALEVEVATTGYIDIKKPFSDDFDLRLMVDGTGTNYISSNAANLKVATLKK